MSTKRGATPDIAEAASRATTRFVELKSQERLDIRTLHRARSRSVAARRTLLNQFRAILFERGLAFPQGQRQLELALHSILGDAEHPLSPRMCRLVEESRGEWRALDGREVAAMVKTDAVAKRLAAVAGMGVLNATALIAAIGHGAVFGKGRDLGA